MHCSCLRRVLSITCPVSSRCNVFMPCPIPRLCPVLTFLMFLQWAWLCLDLSLVFINSRDFPFLSVLCSVPLSVVPGLALPGTRALMIHGYGLRLARLSCRALCLARPAIALCLLAWLVCYCACLSLPAFPSLALPVRRCPYHCPVLPVPFIAHGNACPALCLCVLFNDLPFPGSVPALHLNALPLPCPSSHGLAMSLHALSFPGLGMPWHCHAWPLHRPMACVPVLALPCSSVYILPGLCTIAKPVFDFP